MREKSIFEQAQTYAFQYLEQVFDRNVYPTEAALSDLKFFEEPMPQEPAEAAGVIAHLNQYGAPATTAMLGGRYFGFVNGSSVPAGLAAKTLATFWDQNTAMQVISPMAAKLETVVEKWLKELFGFPDKAVAGFVSGTSSANFCGLAAARYRLLKRMGWDINEQGLFDAPKIRVVAGNHAHSTILKAIGLLGFGKNNVEWVEVDDQGRIRPELMPALDDHTLVILQAGNVNSGAFDAFDEICDKANQANAWVHIDGAFGLWAAAVSELKHLTKGIHKANSWATDGHKTLNTPYDCGVVLCEDKEALVSALHMTGSYIILGDERDGMLYTPEMSRRARIIELWATMKYLGKNGINQMVFAMHERAVQFAEALRKIEGFEVLNEVVFNQVLVRCETDELTAKTIKRIQALRECWVGGSTWFGRKVIRISVCSWATTPEDVRRSAASFELALREM
jgi:glutamate/tyrosine decarboxylase-like PLP-dependent enzyme